MATITGTQGRLAAMLMLRASPSQRARSRVLGPARSRFGVCVQADKRFAGAPQQMLAAVTAYPALGMCHNSKCAVPLAYMRWSTVVQPVLGSGKEAVPEATKAVIARAGVG